jgi:hypothetical protein
MLNDVSVHAVERARFSQTFARPLYATYCFANLPQTIKFLLTGTGSSALPPDIFGHLPERYRRVIFLFVDGFGWRFLQRYAERSPFLQSVLSRGVLSRLTSQFPSTTAAHTTTIHTGLPVGASGIYEWHFYEPLVDEIIAPLLFSYAGDNTRDTLVRSGITPADLYPPRTFYQELQAYGVESHIFQHRSYNSSTFSQSVFRGANVHSFESLAQAFDEMREHLLTSQAAEEGPGYYLLYFDQIDAAGHRFGTESPEFASAIDDFWTTLERLLYRPLQGRLSATLLMLSADHGMVAVNPETTCYLNLLLPEIIPYLRTSQRGRPLVPAGSARDMFLHVREEAVEEVIALLQRALSGKAEIYRTQDLIAEHFFGQAPPSTAFLRRVGNVVILPYQQESVWWFEKGRFEMRFRGHHGGLTPEEMEIPLLLLPLA